jgi:ribonuclease HI
MKENRQPFLFKEDATDSCALGGTQEYRLYTDGGARGNDKGEGNGMGAGAWIITDTNDHIILKNSKYYGEVTNNEAEYLSLIEGLNALSDTGYKNISCYSDSTLLVNQMKGLYKIKKEQLKALSLKVKKLEHLFTRISYHHVPRENPMIRAADRLLNKTLDGHINGD